MQSDSFVKRFSLFNRFFEYLDRRSVSERFIFSLAVLVTLVAGGWLLWQYNTDNQVLVPASGGTLHEGIVGTPRFVNPVLAITRADQDLAELIYRGLFTVSLEGTVVPDLAESLTISEDGLTYNIVLKQNQRFHDDTVLTAADVEYTIGLIQNPEIKSPLRGNWNDATIEVIDDYEFNIMLEEAYVPFIENLTVGILPKHLWNELSADEFPFSQYNTEPIGSDSYQIQAVTYTDAGLIDSYQLVPFIHSDHAPAIAVVEIHFFESEMAIAEALRDGAITHTGALDNETVATLQTEAIGVTVYEQPLPRVFAGFINQNRSTVLRDDAVRAALQAAIDREDLITNVLSGYGNPVTSAIPYDFYQPTSTAATNTPPAADILSAGGWERNDAGIWEKEIDDEVIPLAFTITTANTALFEETANYLATAWQTLGADVSVALFEQSDLVQSVIRPRDYHMLLFGTDVGRAVDLYPFWHSSQREDPGLNVSLYTNISADPALDTYRTTTDQTEKNTLLNTFITELETDNPAIFLFSPTFTYVTTADNALQIPNRINHPSERFSQIHTWYLAAESLWPFLTDYIN